MNAAGMTPTRPTQLDAALPVVYGREAEIGQLRAALDRASLGQGGLVLVGGEAGIGKTALVEVLQHDATARGALVLSGQCYDLGTTPPYGPWVELLTGYVADGTMPSLPSLLAGGALESGVSQDVQFTEVRAFFRLLAQRQMTLLVFEDQHWADPASLELLRFLSRSLRDVSLLIVVTYRDVELTARHALYRYLPQLVREARAVRVSLRRLEIEAIRELVHDRYDLSPADEQRLVAYLGEYAEGIPFFIDELLGALEHDRILVPQGGTWSLGDLNEAQVPLIVRQVIDMHVAWLDEDAQRLLQVAAVIGIEVPLAIWCAATGVAPDDMADVVRLAREARLLDELPGRTGFRFAHALVREALYDSIPLPRRAAWHRAIGEIVSAQADADPDTAAHHFQEADDERAARWLVQAGDRARRANAIQGAVERYEQALRLLERDPRTALERGWLLCSLADAYRYTNPRLSLDYLDRAPAIIERTSDTALAAMVLWSRARIRGFLGENTLADLREAIAAYDALTPAGRERILEMGRGYAGGQGPFAQWLAHHGRYDDAIRVATDCLASQTGEQTALHRSELGHALLGLGLAQAGTGHPEEARRSLDDASRHFRGVGNLFMAAAAVKWDLIEVVYTWWPDNPSARAELTRAYEELWATSPYAVYREERALLPLFPLLILDGKWDEAHETASLYLGASFLRVDALAALGEVERLRGRRAEGWRRVHQAIPHGPVTEPASPFFVRILAVQRLAAELALDDGHADLARDWIAMHDRWLDWSGRQADRGTALLLWARYHRLRGDDRAAQERAEAALACASAPRQPLAVLAARRLLGELALAAGRLDAAADYADQSVALAQICFAPYELALARLLQAELALRRSDADAAEPLLTEAARVFADLRAEPAAERAAALRERLGQPAITGSVPGGLSPREVEVLRLVARGMTDAEVGDALFISPRTVARHLQSVYNKLGVSSRTAATAFAFEHRLV
jgi:DNA-binding CsgD family transcriptional regulator